MIINPLRSQTYAPFGRGILEQLDKESEMKANETWQYLYGAASAADVWLFVLCLVLLIAGVCLYYATGGDKED